MNQSSTFIFGLFMITFVVLNSCNSIPEFTGGDNNQDNESFSDAGSIADDRDKFLGFYIGTSSCTQNGQWNAERFAFYVKDDPDDITKVRVEFPHQSEERQKGWIAIAEGNQLIFDYSFYNEENDCEPGSAETFTQTLIGTATLDGTTFLFPDFTYTVRNAAGENVCQITCNIVAEKSK